MRESDLANGEVKIEGLEETIRALTDLPKEIRNTRILDEAVDNAALLLEREAKRLAPVRTGKLRDSIRITESKSRKDEAVRVEISPHIGYAAFVEFGTKGRAAKPYMRPAYDGSAKTEAINHARDEILADVEELVDKK
jgi:HK97 gp10 family phage protein